MVDTRKAKGVLSDDVLEFITKQGHAMFAANGIKYFITVRPQSATAALSFKRVEKVVGPSGMQLVAVESLDQALEFLRSEGRARVA